jgi:hypothetical protein
MVLAKNAQQRSTIVSGGDRRMSSIEKSRSFTMVRMGVLYV